MKKVLALHFGVLALSIGSFLSNNKSDPANNFVDFKPTKKNTSFVIDGIRYKVEPTTSHIYESKELPFYLNHTYRTEHYRYDGDHRDYYTEYQIEKVVLHRGVYTNFFPTFYSKAVLSTGAVTVSQTIENQYYFGVQQTVSSSYHLNVDTVAQITTKLKIPGIELGTRVETGVGFDYHENQSWAYASSLVGSNKVERKLDTSSAKYCPPEYSISIGLVGEWLEVHGSFTEWHDVMVGSNTMVKEDKFVLRFAPLAKFTETYVYLLRNTLGYLAPETGLIMAEAPVPKC